MDHYHTDNTLFGTEEWFHFARCYADAVKRAPMDRPSRFIEIGAWKGRSTAFMGVEIINSGKPITFYTVDPFTGSKEHRDYGINCTNLYDIFSRNLRPVADVLGDRFKVLQMTSLEAAARMKKPRFDFVFLDGSHEVQDVEADLKAWLPKVVPGGMIAGDDWKFPSVRIPVEREFGKGRVHVPINMQWPYWFWFKPELPASAPQSAPDSDLPSPA